MTTAYDLPIDLSTKRHHRHLDHEPLQLDYLSHQQLSAAFASHQLSQRRHLEHLELQFGRPFISRHYHHHESGAGLGPVWPAAHDSFNERSHDLSFRSLSRRQDQASGSWARASRSSSSSSSANEFDTNTGVSSTSSNAQNNLQISDKKRVNRPLTGKHVKHGNGASVHTLATLRKVIRQRQQMNAK